MSQILNRIRDVDTSDSDAVKEALTPFFQNLLRYKDIDCNRWLRALENVINRFPKYCGTHRPTIEAYLTHFLTSNNYYNVIEAAKCAHAVQQVRPSQERLATAKLCWRDHLIALCDAAHKLIDVLFDRNAGNYFRNQNQKNAFQAMHGSSLQEALSVIDSLGADQNALDKTNILCTRLRNVLVFLQAMLVEIYPVPKPIQPQLILAVILQALSASGNEDSNNVTTIKIQALRTLDALVACLGSNLIPFSSLVFRFVMRTLKWSSENPSEETRKVRIVAYNSLSKWLDSLRVHKPGVEARAWHTELAAHILQDATPVRQVMQLTVNAQPMKNLSKKARKRLSNTLLKESNIASYMPGEKNKNNLSEESNDVLAVAALECAETFLTVCGIFLNATTHKQFQELLVRECFSIQDHGSDRAMCLLHALEACRKCCSVKTSPPTQYCLQLYSVLVNSPQREISKFCSQALLDIRLHLHCSPPSLTFALEADAAQKEQDEGRNKVSERNRAALEKLIGIDWMNPVELNDEIITIPDEPLPKRPRESDNISVSSDSVRSVEMTTDSSIESLIEEVAIIPLENRLLEIERLNTEIEEQNESVVNEVTDAEKNVVDSIEKIDLVDEAVTEKIDLNDETVIQVEPVKVMDINEAATQMPHVSNDTVDGRKTPLSMEVAYDYPNTGNDKVNVLEKMDDENLPSTNDTDDIQITCGQVVKNSQDDDTPVPKVNGVAKENDVVANEDVASKIVPKDANVTVEDMLADFVDEVNEEIQV